jgi:ATP-dependent Clp protease ATP-binding subunit ClpX
MRDIMFEIPSHPDIEKCIITKDTVKNGNSPKLVRGNKESKKEEQSKKVKEKVNNVEG